MKKILQPSVALAALLALPLLLHAQTQPASQPAPPGKSWLDRIDVESIFEENSLYNWIALLVAIVLGIAFGKIAAFILDRINKRLQHHGWRAYACVFSGLMSPASLAFFAAGLAIGLAQLQLSEPLRDFNAKILLLLYTVAAFWYCFNLVSAIEVGLERLTKRTETTLDDQLVPVIRKALRIFIVVIGALFILQNVFERDIGAWLAGLGIAGLAVSLAAQDSLKNLFGTFTIIFDRPFSVGQRIRFDKYDGTIEGIGFRSTRLRTLEGHQVTIPNSNIVNTAVENVQLRPTLRRIFNISLTYDTPPAKVRRALEIIRGLLESPDFRPHLFDPDPVTNADPPRVFFDEMQASSLNIKVHYWFRPVDWWAYLDLAERLNLAIMEAFEKEGIDFAFPTQTIYLASDPKRPLNFTNANADPNTPFPPTDGPNFTPPSK